MEDSKSDEITITYGTLLELLLREKERLELQKLDQGFFQNLLLYLKDKHTIMNNPQHDLFALDEKEKTAKLLVNVRRIVKEVYERREKKIMILALEKSRDKQTLVDNSSFLKEEREMFDQAVQLLDRFRDGILDTVFRFKSPVLEEPMVIPAAPTGQSFLQQPQRPAGMKETKLLRFLHAVPRFVGKELEQYGPFEEEDIAALPIEIADILIRKERAEEIREE